METFDVSKHNIIFNLPQRIVSPYSWVEHSAFAFLVISSLKPRLFLELGVHIGNSFNAFCQAVKTLHTNTKCYGVDSWYGDEQAGFYDESIYYELFKYQQKEYKEFAYLLKMTFDKALGYFSDNSVDLLHIDGFHTYEAVKHDFYSWLPKVSDNGVVILHDTQVREKDFGVWKLWEEISEIYPSFEFKHGFGLGVIAVGSKVNSEFLEFVSEAKKNTFYQNLFFSLGNSIKLLKEKNDLEDLICQKDKKIEDLTTHYFAQLFIDRGRGFNEKEAILIEVFGKERQLEFALTDYKNIKRLRFDPLDKPVKLELHKIEVITANDLYSDLPYISNALYEKEHYCTFEHNDPQIIINVENIEDIQKIIVYLNYISLGIDTYKNISNEKSVIIKTKDEEIKKKDEEIKTKDEEIKTKDEEIKKKNIIIEEQKAYIEKLLEKERILSEIFNSRGWKLLNKYYKLKDILFPENSKRRLLIKKFFRIIANLKNRIKGIDLLLHCDKAELSYDKIEISGWAISSSGIDKIEIYINDKLIGNASYGNLRTDIGTLYDFIENSSNSGFHLSSNLEIACPAGSNHKILIKGINNKGYSREIILSLYSTEIIKPRINCDKIELTSSKIEISGWAISSHKIDRVEIYLDDILTGKAKYGIIRPDVENRYPYINNSIASGFYLSSTLKKQVFKIGDKCTLVIRAITEDGQFNEISKSVFVIKENNPLLSHILSNFYTTPKKTTITVEEPVDIIIPVYNGFEFLDKLFSSLFENTTLPYRLIIVEDCSSDKRIPDYLRNIEKKQENILLIINDENSGFIKSINKAVKYTKNHFVILNTDVEVPPNWLERLMYPIFKLNKIASTTPFTNCGTICSFPDFLEDNIIFENMDVKTLDNFFQQVKALENYFEIPTGVGFCMGINKDIVGQIGMFDEETFKKGYGEENDWCMRAAKKGYKNIIIPNLFVYHKHGGSFASEEKKRLINENSLKLLKKHPDYNIIIQDFIQTDPAGDIRNFLIILISASIDKNYPVFIIDHDIGGGANFYRTNFIENNLKNGKKILLLTYNTVNTNYNIKYFYKNYRIKFQLDKFDEVLELLKFISIEEIFLNELVTFKDPVDVLLVVKKIKLTYGCKLKIPIHDYFSICPSYVLLNDRGKYCGIPDIEECSGCINNNKLEFITTDYKDIKNWRNVWREILELSDDIICFSNSSKEIIKRAYPFIKDDKFSIVAHKVDYISPIKIDKGERNILRIGIIGYITLHKGSKIIKSIIDIIEEKKLKNIRIIIIGEIADQSINSSNVTITGQYKKDNLMELVKEKQIDIFLIPSICPETFSYTTEEIIKMNLPVAVFDLGAPAEKVKKYNKGIVIEKIDPDYAIESLIKWFENNKGNNIELLNSDNTEAGIKNNLLLPEAKAARVDKIPVQNTNIQIVTVVNNFEIFNNTINENIFMKYFPIKIYDNTKENISITRRYNNFIKNHIKDDMWIIFCHQDFGFLEDFTIKLEDLDKNFIYGPIGAGIKESCLPIRVILGQINQGNKDKIVKHGKYINRPEVVDTLDCCCLIIHSSLIKKHGLLFDENLDFHLYSEEFSLNARYNHSIETKAVQFECIHLSYGNRSGHFFKALEYLRGKYSDIDFTSTCLY